MHREDLMMRFSLPARRFTRRATAFSAAVLLALSVTLVASARVDLIRISSDPYTNPTSQHRTEVEPDTFAFGNTIVSAFQVGRFFNGGASNIGWATSTNGGRTWSHGFLPATTVFATPPGSYDRTSDPSVAYDAKRGVWLISYLAIHDIGGAPGVVDVLVSRSTDGGRTWDQPVAVRKATGTEDLDKNWTVCDDTPSSPFYGHCYTEWDDFGNINRVQMSTSTDGGKTWGAPKTTPDHACVIGGQPLVQPNGTVIVPIDDCFETAVLAFRSTDGGQSWSRAVLAAQITSSLVSGNLRTGPLPSAEMDQSGRVYVVWQDCRFEPPNCAFNDIVMTTSDDGIHWSLVKRVPIDPIGRGVDHFIPGLAVDPSTSGRGAHLGLAYYYYPNGNCGTFTTAPCQLNVGFVSSTNGGASWSDAEQLAGPMLLEWLPATTQGRMVGDYISTSIVPANDATPVFAVARQPSGAPDCFAVGAVCHEDMYTAPEDLLRLVGGTNTAGNEPVFEPSLSAQSRQTTRSTAR